MTPASNLLMFIGVSVVITAASFLFPKSKRFCYLAVINTAFYAFCDIKTLVLLIACAVWSWFCAKRLEQKRSKGMLAAGIIPLAGLLLAFKYCGKVFSIVDLLTGAAGTEKALGAMKIILPLGISYYIFKTISYLADVYRGKYPAEKDPVRYYAYVSYFAEILCGPISRWDEFSRAADIAGGYSKQNVQRGFYLVLQGTFMKAVIADRLAGYVSAVFGAPESFPGLALWGAAFFYAVELYCDFAGYSYIAVGVTTAMGMHRTENFRRPYFSQSIKEFWNRWHISLSHWLRDYIYIPLGGSRCSKLRKDLNVTAVFLVSGIWHGAGLNFIVWGLYHGLCNILSPKKQYTGVKKFFMTLLTFFAVMMGWIVFGTPSLKAAGAFYLGMFTDLRFTLPDIQSALLPFTNDNTSVAYFLTAAAFIVIWFFYELICEKKNRDPAEKPPFLWQVFLLAACILFGCFGTSSFMYANF